MLKPRNLEIYPINGRHLRVHATTCCVAKFYFFSHLSHPGTFGLWSHDSSPTGPRIAGRVCTSNSKDYLLHQYNTLFFLSYGTEEQRRAVNASWMRGGGLPPRPSYCRYVHHQSSIINHHNTQTSNVFFFLRTN